MSRAVWMMYGASGDTGTLIAEEAIRRGHLPLLVGCSPRDAHVGLHHPQGKKVEWEKMFRHRDRRSLEPCEPESKTGPGGCRNHALLRWREDPFR